ncbi:MULTISPECIES: helix-turn-helix domain-containing protein [unclassified Amycolatopsis]|uniref:helix-turn-helix domain-containing protein n=1 Tax=unclassified Amycolatopsis TaxID=2618356 RepID=UPI001C6A6C56|nr:helix-turn-helix transcriptional regulator [Amycolatopsis sp. DSM 110486]QYN20170.1 helix-turn-helix domain-containing protein [Amycolatopsis sp. DSM 110486]
MTDEHLAHVVGSRVRFFRSTKPLTKTVVAGLAGITPDYLYQIERGVKMPTIPVLVQLAHVLDVEPGDLLNEIPPARRKKVTGNAGDALQRALTRPAAPADAPILDDLREDVVRAWHTWQTSPHRYSELSAELPEMIAGARAAVNSSDARDRRAAHRYAADLYGLVRTVTKRVGRGDLSLLAADRALREAEAADDPIRLAAARWNLGQVLLADGSVEGAEEEAVDARASLQPLIEHENVDALALSGSLLLLSAIAAVRSGNRWTARDRLREAVPLAQRVGEHNACWTAFGPTNVAMFAVSIEVESGEAVEGLRLAETIDHDRSPSVERRVAFLVDQAKGYTQRRDYSGALLMLQAAEAEAPEDIQYRPAVHGVLGTLTDRGRGSVARQAASLAKRAGLPTVS